MEEKIDNVLLIGRKNISSYIRGLNILFSKNKQVFLKARGRNILTAIDVTEAAVNNFLSKEGIKKGKIEISTKELEDKDKRRFVREIEIELLKL